MSAHRHSERDPSTGRFIARRRKEEHPPASPAPRKDETESALRAAARIRAELGLEPGSPVAVRRGADGVWRAALASPRPRSWATPSSIRVDWRGPGEALAPAARSGWSGIAKPPMQ